MDTHVDAQTPQSLLQQAAALLSSGQAQKALWVAEQSLKQLPDNAGLNTFAGVCAASIGEFEQAERYWRQAITIDANDARAHLNLGMLYAQQGRDDEAEDCYRRVVAIDPGNAGAYANLGILLTKLQRQDEAEQNYRQAIAVDPANLSALTNLGNALARSRRFEEAERCFRQLISHRPADGTAHFNLGLLLEERGKGSEAEQSYRRCLDLNPGHTAACSRLGHLLMRGKRYREAESSFRKAVAINPASAQTHIELGMALERLERDDEAEASYRNALVHDTYSVIALTNLGILLAKQNKQQEAEGLLKQAIALSPTDGMAHYNLGVLLEDNRNDDEAESYYRQAIALNADNAAVRLKLSHLQLRQGRFAEGWPALEVRYSPELPEDLRFPLPCTLNFPQWQGEPLKGKSLLVWPEQGYGDEIQFCRYLPLLKQQGASITLMCKAPLKPLLETLEGVDKVACIDEGVDAIAMHDYWTYPLSLPLHCNTELETIPAQLPYLHAAPERVTQWAPRLPTDGLRVGLVWKGSATHQNDKHRSLPGLASLAPLWNIPGVRFISLQKGQSEDEALGSPADQPMLHLGSEMRDFADTAALVSQLDLIITVDTAIAHVAGALNKPCWVLLPAHRTDWRWLDDRGDSPWYPGVMRLFRQIQDQDWTTVIADVETALHAIATAR